MAGVAVSAARKKIHLRMLWQQVVPAWRCIQTSIYTAAALSVGRPARADRANGGKAKPGPAQFQRRVAEAEEPDIKLYPFGTMPSFKPRDDSPAHRPSGNAVFGALFSENMMPKDVKSFTGTLRKNFDGDIVVAVHPGLKPNLLQLLKDYNAIVYEITVTCSSDGMGCTFTGAPDMEKMPLAQLRSVIVVL